MVNKGENMRHVIIFIGGIAAALAVRMLNRDAEKKDLEFDKDGDIVLRMSKIYDFLGYMIIAFGLMAVALSQFGAESPMESLIIMIIGIFTILMGIFQIVFVRGIKVMAGQVGIRYVNFTGKEKQISWDEIKEIKFVKFKNSIYITSNTEGIRIRMDFVGVRSFIDLMKGKLPASLYGQALDKFEIQRPRYK